MFRGKEQNEVMRNVKFLGVTTHPKFLGTPLGGLMVSEIKTAKKSKPRTHSHTSLKHKVDDEVRIIDPETRRVAHSSSLRSINW